MTLAGRRVRVYRNLTLRCLSVLGPDGRLVAHVDRIALAGARFVVQPGGQRRARRDGVRNVHAWIEGVVLPSGSLVDRPDLVRLTYDPFKDPGFVRVSDRTQVTAAGGVVLGPEGLRAYRPT